MPDSLEDNTSCRICMDSTDSYVSLFTHDLSVKVMEVADVQVDKDDGLPETICTQCETDLEKCYEFRLKVQVSDKRFRDNIKYSKVDIEECNIKEEREMDDGNSDNLDDKDSIIMDDDNCNDEPDVVLKNTEEIEEPEPDPMNHVVVIEEKERKVDISEDPDPLRQDEAMMEVLQVKKVEEPPVDPFVCMKEETEIMDIESLEPETFGPSSSGIGIDPLPITILPSDSNAGKQKAPPKLQTYLVMSSEPSKSHPILPPRAEEGSGQLKEHSYLLCRQVASNNSFALSPLNNLDPGSSITSKGLIMPVDKTSKPILFTKLPPSVSALMPGDPKFYQNIKPKVKSISKRYIQIPNVSISKRVKIINPAPSDRFRLNNPITNERKGEGSVDPKVGSVSLKKKFKIDQPTESTALNKELDCSKPESATLNKVHKPGTSAYTVKPRKESFCWVCNVSCGTIELLQEHKERKGFICRTCTSSFNNHVELETHFISHTPFKCKTCGEIFHFKKDLFRHRSSERCSEPLNYSCEYCDKQFLRSTQLKSHLWTHKKVEERNSEMCVVCKKIFKNSQFLMTHEKTSHLVYEYLECDTCHKLLLGPGKLKCHIQTVHIEPSEDAQFPCPTCGKILTNKSALNSHIVDKHDDTQYVCEVCGESLLGKKTMQLHMKYKHSERTFTCTLCNEQFDSKGKLSTHRKHHNKKEKPPKAAFCEICGKTYKTEQILRIHLQIHSDEKPFKCEICGASFKQKTTLGNHSRVHKSVGKYICSECGLSFNWKQTFEKHVNNCEGNNDRDDNTDSS